MKEILMKKHKTNEQNIGNILEMLQRETIDVMGLLPKLRTISEKAKGERGRGQECSDINKTFAALWGTNSVVAGSWHQSNNLS